MPAKVGSPRAGAQGHGQEGFEYPQPLWAAMSVLCHLHSKEAFPPI